MVQKVYPWQLDGRKQTRQSVILGLKGPVPGLWIPPWLNPKSVGQLQHLAWIRPTSLGNRRSRRFPLTRRQGTAVAKQEDTFTQPHVELRAGGPEDPGLPVGRSRCEFHP